MPRVSVVVPVYNLEDIVLETIHSLLNQSFRDLELIVTDDGSTDGTLDLLRSIDDPRMTVIAAAHSGLPSVGANTAVAHATGEYFVLTGADDVSEPDRFQKQVEFLDAHPEAGMVHTDYHRLIDGELFPNTTEDRLAAGIMPADEVLRRLLWGNFICTPTTMVRRSAVDLTDGLYNPDPRICGPEDFDLWLRMAEAGVSFGYIDEPLTQYRIRPDSVSRNRARSLAGDVVTINTALRRSPETYAPHRRLVTQRLAYLHRELAGCKFRSGTPGGWAELGRAMKYAPFNLRTWSWGGLGLLGPNGTERVLSLRSRFLGRENE